MADKSVGRLNLSREELAWMQRENLRYPVRGLVDIPQSEWPLCRIMPSAVKRNRQFMVQIFPSANGAIRLSIQRCEFDRKSGHWKDGITWDELQAIKDDAGFAGVAAVEIYPPTDKIVDMANLRHLWVLPEPPAFMWGLIPAPKQEGSYNGK